MLLWLSLFKAETTEELEKINQMEVPVMSQAINAYYTITASSEFRERERLLDKARHDEAQALHNAEHRGRTKGRAEGRAEGRVEGRVETQAEVVQNALKLHLPVDTIRQLTGLSAAEIEELRRQA